MSVQVYQQSVEVLCCSTCNKFNRERLDVEIKHIFSVLVSLSTAHSYSLHSSYKLMKHCWQLDPVARPSATDLVRLFESCSDLSDDDHLAADGVRDRDILSPPPVVEDDTIPAAQISTVSCAIDVMGNEQHLNLTLKPSPQSQVKFIKYS